MRKPSAILFLTVLFSLLVFKPTSAQEHSIWFTYPTNGSITGGTIESRTESSIIPTYSFNDTESHSASFVGWKFKLYVDGDLSQTRTVGKTIPVTIPSFAKEYFSPGNYQLKIELFDEYLDGELYKASQTISFTVKHKLKVSTNVGGNVKIDGATVSSGSSKLKSVGAGLSAEAIDQTISSDYYLWNSSGTNNSKWKKIPLIGSETPLSESRNYSYTVQSDDNGTELKGDMRLRCRLTFDGISGGSIVVNSSTYSYPTSTFYVTEKNEISAQPNNIYGANGINQYFDHWSDGSTQCSRTFYPEEHKDYTVYYKGYATTSSMNVHFVGDPGDPITIDWDDHPCTDVTQYRVYRYPSTLLATRNRGTTSYTDYGYTFWDGEGQSYNLKYAVTAYYSPDQTWSSQNWRTVTGGEPEWNMEDETENTRAEKQTIQAEEEKELSLANHPNPFNPETIINYTNPENSLVTIKVYDMLGREVRTLVNEVKDAGNYSVRFNASSMPSGVYIYTIQTNRSTLSKKMILMK